MTQTIMQCYTTTIGQMKPCTLDVRLLNSCGYFTSRVSKDERAHMCVWCARMTLRVMTVCVRAGDIKGWRSASLPLPSAGIPPSAGGLSPGHFGGALTWVPTVRLSKQKPDTLIRTSSRGWNNTSPATSASFPCTRPSVSRYKVRSGRRSAHVHLWCNSTTRLRHFLNSSIDRNLGFLRALYTATHLI